MIRFIPLHSLAYTSALFAAGAAFSAPQATDYSKLQPGASTEAKVLRTATISFMDALQRARAAGGGEVLVMNALVDGETVKYEALVQSNGIAKRILINAKTGEATAPNVPLHTAIKTALETVQGTPRLLRLGLDCRTTINSRCHPRERSTKRHANQRSHWSTHE